jgi:hypothetical protein
MVDIYFSTFLSLDDIKEICVSSYCHIFYSQIGQVWINDEGYDILITNMNASYRDTS